MIGSSSKSDSVSYGNESGRIVQIIGPVIDIEFPNNKIPKVYNALVVEGAADERPSSYLRFTAFIDK